MSGWFIVTLAFAVIAVLTLVFGFMADEDGPVVAGVGLVAVTLVLLLISSVTTIPTRTVGVVTAFGRPSRALSNGWHWIAPWQKVEKFDASIQTLKLDAAGKNCVTVRLANQTTACVDVSVQWNVDAGADVIDLYKRYRTFDNIETNLVHRQLQRAMNIAFEKYDPLRSISGAADQSGQSLDDLSNLAENTLRAAVGGGVAIANVTIPLVHYDATTEERLKAYQQSLADTRIADQRKQTAQKVAEANGILAGSQSTHDPGVEYQNCLDMVERSAKAGGNLPAGFSCGAGAAVVVGAK
jgi:regulator of protease activity HflC (stomatin/prohibitin superfamily)